MMRSTQNKISFKYKIVAGVVLLVAMFVVSIVFGAANTTLKDVWLALTTSESSESVLLIREIRLPREVGALFVGAALAVSGAIMQGMTRNPLADPGLLGLTAGANAALALTIALLPSANDFYIMIACFLGATVGSLLLVFIIGATKKGRMSPFRIVLAGAAVSAFLTAIAEGIGIVFKISKDISMWTAGGLVGTSWSKLVLIVPVIVTGILLSYLFSKHLTILSLSEEVAVGLGQKTAAVKVILFIVVIMLAGASVALVGNMTFVGLMIPHIVRTVAGTDYRYVIPLSAVTGAAFMLFADTLGRTINAPYETPVAAIVAMLGLPFFLLVVHRGGKAFS